MSNRFVAVALVGAILAVLLGTTLPAQAQPGGGGCQLAGTAYFKPGLNNNQQNFTDNFVGKLSGCQASPGMNAPASGTVTAGRVFKHAGLSYQEPVPKGNGSCGEGTTSGISIAKWSDGSYSVIKYSTQSLTGAVVLQGTPGVIPSVKLKAIHPKPGQPTSYTVRSTVYNGDGALGTLTFSPKPDPTACGGTTGVASAGINGFTGLGSES